VQHPAPEFGVNSRCRLIDCDVKPWMFGLRLDLAGRVKAHANAAHGSLGAGVISPYIQLHDRGFDSNSEGPDR
jgi:hypothetical protein